MNVPFLILILIIGGVFVTSAILTAFSSKGFKGFKRWHPAIGGSLMAVGGFGFFGSAFSAGGGLNRLPSSFEWPVGHVNGVVSTRDGTHVVPHTPSGRIQIYDEHWKFVRGWHIKAGAGVFHLRIINTNQIEVVTARGRSRYLYSLEGTLIDSSKMESLEYPGFADTGVSAEVPTPWWLWTFTNPFHSWAVFMLGMLLLVFGGKLKAEKP